MANITFAESSGVNNSIFGKSEAPIKLFLEKKAEAFEAESIVKQIYNMDTSTHYAEKFTAMTAMDGPQPVGENGNHPVDGMRESYAKTIEHMTWKDRFSITREMVDDGRLMDMKGRPQAFISAWYRNREQFGAALLAGAISGTTKTYKGQTFSTASADGKALFATDHPSIMGGAAQTNKFAGEITASNITKLETAMQNFKGDNGELLNLCPNTIIIPNIAAAKEAVFAAVGSDKDPATANNAWNYQVGRWNVIVWNYLNQFLTGADIPWMMFDTRYNEDAHGLEWLDRTQLEVTPYVDHDTNAFVWDGFGRFGVGFNDWRAIAVAGITGGSDL